jgi:hypothetical protein
VNGAILFNIHSLGIGGDRANLCLEPLFATSRNTEKTRVGIAGLVCVAIVAKRSAGILSSTVVSCGRRLTWIDMGRELGRTVAFLSSDRTAMRSPAYLVETREDDHH